MTMFSMMLGMMAALSGSKMWTAIFLCLGVITFLVGDFFSEDPIVFPVKKHD